MSLTPVLRLSKPEEHTGQMTMPPFLVVQLNVGGILYTTTLGTLQKVPGSKLAEMFSNPCKVCRDAEDRFFIDRPGACFGPILDYLRSGQVPTQRVEDVYREAQFYDLQPLLRLLEDTPQMFGEQVARRQFVLRVPSYNENLELLVRLARAEAMAARRSVVLVCAVHTDQDLAFCVQSLRNLENCQRSVVKFGPWKAAPDDDDLLDCVLMDIRAQGYQVTRKPSTEKAVQAKASSYFHTFLFTWW
ncbi:BTB/POZ domain-containing protein KCTD14 [Erinaceus europaeus]|uniref:BTB/POZ domain-containing protein KCTD14 n=1 Tax=Erinaceus europaeus TaxID=9365 RepID=A0ABM3W7Y0_ERIEU|nr:BTB/POZ domain-containing protein KCTD14 [Erinaceus europaeus]